MGIAINGRIRVGGEVVELDKNKEVKWKIQLEDSYPVDAISVAAAAVTQ